MPYEITSSIDPEILKKVLWAKLAFSAHAFSIGDFESAMPQLLIAEQISRQLGEKRFLAKTLGHIAVCLKHRGEVIKAYELHKEEEALCLEIGDNKGLAYALLDQARILCEKGEVKTGLDLYLKAEEISRSCDEWGGLFIALFNYAFYAFYDTSNLQKAQSKCREALNLTDTRNVNMNDRPNTLNLLAEIDEKLGIQ